MADQPQDTPESSPRRVAFLFPWTGFAHYPQRTDPQDLPQTPPPDPPSASATDTPRPRRRRRRARDPITARCLTRSTIVLAAAVVFMVIVYICLDHMLTDVRDPEQSSAPWAFWRFRKNDIGIPRILLWNRIIQPFSYNTSSEVEMRWSSNITECPIEEGRSRVVTCEITDNRTRFEWSDAVVFEANRLSMFDMPDRWPRFPIWVLWAPIHISPDSKLSAKLYPEAIRARFNWTMGRREDADIVVPYKSWRCGVRGDVVVSETAERNRKALGRSVRSGQVAWISSTCETGAFRRMREGARYSGEDKSGRLGARLVKIDMFDKCGRGTCSTPLECVKKIATRYRFIVVRLQPDCFHSPYEIIYEAFEYDLVPVVLAPANTTLNVPSHSVVNTESIQQPGQLATFLTAIMDHPAEYERYFEWKKRCSLIRNRVDLCPLCQALHEKFARQQAHPDAYEWWTARAACSGYTPRLYGLDWAFTKTDEPWL